MIETLQRACAGQAHITEAWLYQTQLLDRDEPPHLTVGIQLRSSVDRPDAERVARSIGRLVDPARWGYEFVDFQFLEGDILDTVRANGVAVFSAD